MILAEKVERNQPSSEDQQRVMMDQEPYESEHIDPLSRLSDD